MSDILSKLRAFYENAETDECLADIREAIGELERFYAEPGWIPVEERWPEHLSDVLVAYKCGDYVRLGVGEFDGTTVNDEGMTVPYFKGIGGFEVTHWMPLPEPPKCATH